MKQHSIVCITLILFVNVYLKADAQFKNLFHKADSTFSSNLKEAQSTIQKNSATKSSSNYPLSQTTKPSLLEMDGGIKQALEKGLIDGVKQVSSPNGFFKNAEIKLLFPPEAQKVEQTLRSLGMNKLCDDVILSMNRAAEDASKKAAPIFIQAIHKMSIHDAEGILAGPDNSATQFFQTHTQTSLIHTFKPTIDSSLEKVRATAYYSQAVNIYNQLPLISHKLNPNLSDYATTKATDGLFKIIAQQELKIRTQSGARSTPLMRKVFSYFQKR